MEVDVYQSWDYVPVSGIDQLRLIWYRCGSTRSNVHDPFVFNTYGTILNWDR